MAIQNINTGSGPNAGNGDTLRSAFSKVNDNFSYIFNTLTNLILSGGSSGESGYSGISGYSGESGYSGISGYSGAAGSNNVGYGFTGNFAFYPETGNLITNTNFINVVALSNTVRIGNDFNTTTNFVHIKENYSPTFGSGVTFSQCHDNPDANNFTFYRTRGRHLSQRPLRINDDIVDIAFITQSNNFTLTGVANITVSVENTFTAYPTGVFKIALNNGNLQLPLEIAEFQNSSTLKVNHLDSLTPYQPLKINNDLVPNQDLTYDLGSTSSQWRSLYVGTSTIYLGGTALSVSGGNLTVDGTPVVGGTGVTTPYDGVFVITNTTTNTTSDTGALVVAGGVGIGGNLHVQGYGHFGLEPTIAYTNPLAILTGNADDFTQLAIQNLNSGSNATSDLVATADDGTDELFYINLGINNSNYNDPTWNMSGPHDGYLYVSNGILTLGTAEPDSMVKIHVGGTTEADVVAIFRAPTTDSTGSFSGALSVNGGIGITGQMHLEETLHVGGNHLMLPNAVFIGSRVIDSYVQLAVQNQSPGTSASSDFIATADNGDDTSYYIDLGINGSGYNNPDWTISGPNDGYLYINSGSLTLGTDTTGTNVKIHIGGTLAENVVATFDANSLTLAQHVLPAADLTYDLGSTSSQWRSLYVGTSTIYLGGTALSVSGGTITVDGNPVSGGGGASLGDRLTSSTYSVILEGTTGTVSVPNSIISQGSQLNLAGSQNSYDIGRYLRVRDGDFESHLHLDTPDNSLYDIILGNDSKFVRVDHTGTVVIGTNGVSSHNWTFGTDGLLTLPSGTTNIGSFYGSDAILCNTGTAFGIVSQGAGSSLLQWLDDINSPTVVAGIAANSLYSNTGSVQIYTGAIGSPPQNTWTFSDDGNLTFPDSTIQTTAYTGIASSGTTATSAAVGYIGMPQNKQNNTYSVQITDQGKHIYCTGTSFIVTIPATTVTNFPIGSTIAFIAGPNTTATIAIQTDTMYLGGSTGTSGSRTLAPFGMATAVKVEDTIWFISGAGLT